jgi:hypothetical protein
MPVSDGQELINPLRKGLGILPPGQVVQKDAHHVEPDLGCPAKFLVNDDGIEGVFLPHFKLVNRGAGHVIKSNDPGKLA